MKKENVILEKLSELRFLSEEVDNIVNLLTKIIKTGRKNETH